MKNPGLPVRVRHVVAAIVLSVATISTASAETAFSKMVVFGDSLNDTGNMVRLTNGLFPAPPNYAFGRESNGPVWVEYLANRLGLADKIANYAVAGAMTKPAPGFPTGNVYSDTFGGLEGTDVSAQVLDYLRDSNGAADPAALFILEGGSNDFQNVADPRVIVANLLESLVTLELSGARHIILVNLPDLGKAPRVILGEQSGVFPPGTAAFVSSVCAQLNQALTSSLPLYTSPGVTITIADAYGFIDEVAANPAAFGFVNVQEPFLVFGAGGNPDTWLFWDDLHPTTRGHAIFSGKVVVSLVRSYSPGQGNVGNGAINGLNGLVKARGH